MINRITSLSGLDLSGLVVHINTLESSILSGQKLVDYYQTYLTEILDNPAYLLLEAERGNYILLRQLDLASEIFAKNIWQIELIACQNAPEIKQKAINKALTFLHEKKAALIICKAAHDDLASLHGLEGAGFRLYGGNQTYRIKRIPESGHDLPAAISCITGDGRASDEIAALVKNRFSEGHYFLDTRLSGLAAKEFFARIIGNYYAKSPDRFILFFKEDRLHGFSFLRAMPGINQYLSKPMAQIEYTVFDTDARYHANAVFNQMGRAFHQKNPGPVITEIAINNSASWRFWTRSGANTIYTSFIFHKWLDTSQ